MLDALAHARQSLHAVAGVESRRVDLILEPIAVGQAILERERALHGDQPRVGLAQGRRRRTRGHVRHGLPVVLRCALERGHAVVERREIQKRRNLFLLRRNGLDARIFDGRENSLVDLAIPFHSVLARIARQFPHLVHVAADGFAEIVEIERQQIGVRQTHDGNASGLRQGAPVDEVLVREMRVPVEIVVDGVVNAAAILASIGQVQRCHAQVVDEHGVVRAGAQRGHAQIGPRARFLPIGRAAWRLARDLARLQTLPHGHAALRVVNVARHAVHELL